MAWERLRGREIPSVWARSVPEETIQRAVGLFVVTFGLVTLLWVLFRAPSLGSARDYFVGLQLRFTDHDLKTILPFAPSGI